MTSTLFITGIISGVVFLIIFLFTRLHNKGKATKIEKQSDLIAGIISNKKLEIKEMETINNHFLGIDRTNFFVLYYSFTDQENEPLLIDLWQIKSAKVITEDHSIYEQRKGKPVLVDKKVNKLKIQLSFVDGHTVNDLVLYEYRNAVEDFVQIKKRAEYWCHLTCKAAEEIQGSMSQKSKYA